MYSLTEPSIVGVEVKFKTAGALNNSLKFYSPYETLRCALVPRLTKKFLCVFSQQLRSCDNDITAT